MKTDRQKALLRIIQTNEIEKQEDLLLKLKSEGYHVTQATISRDIRELKITKSLTNEGKYRYTSPLVSEENFNSKFTSLFKDTVTGVISAGNIVAVKCESGMAQAVCAALDAAKPEEVVATLAGDDTIFVLCSNDSSAVDVCERLNRLIGW